MVIDKNMESKVCIQPFSKNRTFMLGNELKKLLGNSNFKKIWFVSFSVKKGAIIRILPDIKTALKNGTKIYLVLGIDHNSTSVEALAELVKLPMDSKIFKDVSFAHTFHPKIYLFEGTKKAELFIGSNNLTVGGMFTNYESCIHNSYELPKDAVLYKQHKQELEFVIKPKGNTVQKLTKNLINSLKKSNDVVNESSIRQVTIKNSKRKSTLFGSGKFPELPIIPVESQQEIIKQSKKTRSVFTVTAAFIQLNKIKGSTIPGEVRIPKALRNIDEAFWAWPSSYNPETRMQGKKTGTYRERITKWQIIDVANPSKIKSDMVRIYDYGERGEFRFYSHKLVDMGADELDIVKLTLHTDKQFDYLCELAKRNSPSYDSWLINCTNPIIKSKRKFGFHCV